MGLMKRREFLVGGLTWMAPTPQDDLTIEVMEVFSSSRGPSALLVHHADEATRETFSNWLRRNSGREIVCGFGDGTSVTARIYRVSLCFGRGLILFSSPTAGVRANNTLNVRLR